MLQKWVQDNRLSIFYTARRVLAKLLKITIITLYNESEENILNEEKTLKSDIIFENLFSAKRKTKNILQELKQLKTNIVNTK